MINNTKSNTALLIQGPYIKNITEQTINKNKNDFREIVFSTWDNSERFFIPNIKLIKNPLPKVNNFHNSQNIYFQVCSIIYGLENIKSKFVIKTRSDEYFSNLKLLAEEALEDKLIISNIFIKNVSYAKFHISDHLFLGEKDILLKAFKLLKSFLEKNQDDDKYNINNEIVPAEVKIALFFLNAKGYAIKTLIESSENEAFKIMISEFKVFDIEILKPYLVSSSAIGKIRSLKNFCMFDGTSGVNYYKRIEDLSPQNKISKKVEIVKNGIKRRIFKKIFFKIFKILI